ncbi:MAG: prepilin-type N-terminal cleavage/methylation domain-containing protein [Pseudanabaena sp. CAN_BIN31]|nr:prepilin-type N-terminal cleavage/methylation domain-containing protein [Pseudanabaena sp. CAN_BIN31]
MSLSKYSNSFSSDKIFHKKLLFNILQKRQNKEQGFTLIELLVAMAILTIVVGMTGTGLLFIISTNTKSDIQITQQANLRRAADFISDEIKAASVVSTTAPNPVWITGGFTTTGTTTTGINPVGTDPSAKLYLEIPIPIEPFPPSTSITSSTTLTIKNHGLTKGNAIKFSGTGLPSGINTTETYYIKTLPTANPNNTFTVVKVDPLSSTATDISFTVPATPLTTPVTPPPIPSFAIRRLVMYYTAKLTTADETKWKGPNVLYRATGNCTSSNLTTYTSDAINCLVMVDSLILPTTSPIITSPFTVTTTPSPNTLTINGQICTPASMLNTCPSPSPTPDLTSVTVQAVSRATLK